MSRPRSRSVAAAAVAIAMSGVTLAWVIGQVFRDRFLVTAWCFYLPSSVLAVALLAAALLCRHQRRVAVVLLGLAVAPLGWVLAIENRWTRPPAAAAAGETPLRVVHWNVKWGDHGWRGVVDELLAFDADAYLLSECYEEYGFERFRERGYRVVCRATMAVVARGELGPPTRVQRGFALRHFAVDWVPPDERLRGAAPVRLLMIDISSFLRLHRDPVLRRVRRLMGETRPDLVAGDFNSPRRSLALAPPPAGYRHAYDVAGAGWSATWPLPAPVLAIDQMLLGDRVRPLRYGLQSSWRSDHRRQHLACVVRPRGDAVSRRSVLERSAQGD